MISNLLFYSLCLSTYKNKAEIQQAVTTDDFKIQISILTVISAGR